MKGFKSIATKATIYWLLILFFNLSPSIADEVKRIIFLPQLFFTVSDPVGAGFRDSRSS